MRTEFCFINSILLHIALAILLVWAPSFTEQVKSGAGEKVEITIIQPKPPKQESGNLILPGEGKKKKPTESGPGPKQPDSDEGDDETGKKLEKQLTITNYMERIKAIIDPIWYGMVRERLNHLRRRGERIRTLQVEVTVHVSPSGAITKRWVSRTCGRADFDQYATRAFDIAGNLPPPPSNLLENGKLVLFWDFTVNTR